jgi:L-aspartate oxidase
MYLFTNGSCMSELHPAALSASARDLGDTTHDASHSVLPNRIYTRVLVIGSGVAGLHTAWRAAEQCANPSDIVLLTKQSLLDSASSYAQGGIAAALGAGDSPALHRRDTLAAGGILCDRDAVDVLVTEGPRRVRELRDAGVHFDVGPHGEFLLGREAAHGERRIVHAHGDRTGAEVVRMLVERVRADKRIEVMEHARALDLLIQDGTCYGARVSVRGRAVELIADATVLATGGCGQVFRFTTNPSVATGDGYALAHRAGAELTDMEFIQFHPTALDSPETPLALISEAVRGEGATLLDASGDRFMLAADPMAELAPRDVVTRAVVRAQRETGRVFLDATCLGEKFASRFPGIFAVCMARGIDPRRSAIPVTPAAHYTMGGVVTDLDGRTSLSRLFAVGEVACTGVHGANRLASNSLLEGLVFAERVARAGVEAPQLGSLPAARRWAVPLLRDEDAALAAADELRALMWEHAGIERTSTGLRICLEALNAIAARLPASATDAANMALTARLITEAALLREESRGGHYRSDFPQPRRAFAVHHVRSRMGATCTPVT